MNNFYKLEPILIIFGTLYIETTALLLPSIGSALGDPDHWRIKQRTNQYRLFGAPTGKNKVGVGR